MSLNHIINGAERAVCGYARAGALLFVNLPLGLTLATALAVGLLYELMGMSGYDAAVDFLGAAAFPVTAIALKLLVGVYMLAALLCWRGYPSSAHRRAEVVKWLMLAVRHLLALAATAKAYSWPTRAAAQSQADEDGARRDERTPHDDGSHPQLK